MKNKEQTYDEEISPLIGQVISICKENGIAMVMSFAIPTEEDDGLRCTTILPNETGKNEPEQLAAYQTLRAERTPLNMKTDHGDGTATFTTIL